MDPDATYAMMLGLARELIARIDSAEHDGGFDTMVRDADSQDLAADLLSTANDLAEHVKALDEWLSRGGFIPDALLGPDTGQAPNNRQALALGRLLRQHAQNRIATVSCTAAGWALPDGYIAVSMPIGTGLHAAGIAPDGRVST